MNKTEEMHGFIIKILYIGIWCGIVYFVFKYVLPLFLPFVIGFFIAFSLKNPINRISSKFNINRKLTAIFILIFAYLCIGALLFFAGTRLIVQLSFWFAELPRFYSNSILPAATNVTLWLKDFNSNLSPEFNAFLNSASKNLASTTSGFISAVSSGAISYLSSFATKVPVFLFSFFFSIISSFFCVVDYYKITAFITSQLSPKIQRKIGIIQDVSINVVWRFARAYLILMSLTFIELSIGLNILKVPSAFLIAFFTAIVDVLPVFGSGAILIPWALYTLFTGNIAQAIGLGVIYAVITLVRQIVEPKVVGHQIGLYPLLTLMCMFVGVRLLGIIGMLSFPIILAVLIHLNHAGEISFFKNPAPQENGGK